MNVIKTLSTGSSAARPYIVGNLYITFGTSLFAGIGNGVASIVRTDAGVGDATIDFFHAMGGNLGFGLLVNFIPATFNQKFAGSKNFWLTGNLMMIGMNLLMLGFHYLIQTENPVEARAVPTIASQIIENLLIVSERRKRVGS
jgi:hypothetical protein